MNSLLNNKHTNLWGAIVPGENAEKVKGMLLVAVSAASYGLIPVFAKTAYAAGTDTYTLLFLRFLAATPLMFLLLFLRKVPLPSLREILVLLGLGAGGYGAQAFFYLMALNYASTAVVIFIIFTYPALVMIGSALFFREKVTLPKVIALSLALAGAFLIIEGEWEASSTGIILALLAAVVYTAYLLVSSRVVKAGRVLPSSAFLMLGSLFFYGFIDLCTGFRPPTRLNGLVAIAMLALISTVLAFWSFFAGLQKTGPSTAALVATLEPVVAVLSSVLILAEPLTARTVLGGTLVLAALVVTALPWQETQGAG